MEVLLAPDLLGKIIQTIGAIIVAIITKWGVTKFTDKSKSEDEKQLAGVAQQKKSQSYFGWVITGIVAAVTFGIFGLVYDSFTPDPTIKITSPNEGASIEVRIADTGSASFFVDGNSARVINNSDMRVYVLIHPADPFAEGWWIQPSVVMNSDGTWSGQAWIGDSDFPPKIGNLIDIVAVVTTPEEVEGHTKVNDPKDLNPTAQSDTMRVDVGSTKQ